MKVLLLKTVVSLGLEPRSLLTATMIATRTAMRAQNAAASRGMSNLAIASRSGCLAMT